MVTEQKEQEKTQETRQAGTEETQERRPTSPKESLEGMPGYGQPPEEVRQEKLPEQEW